MTRPELVVITGASSGIGEHCARVLSAKNYIPILVARRKDALETVARGLKGPSHIIVGDINDPATDQEILSILRNQPLRGLINNAGRYVRSEFSAASDTDWLQTFQTNLFSAARLTRNLLPALRAHDTPAIVNVSSTLGMKPVPHTSVYSASKAAMNSWTQALALELAPKIRVSCVCPGIIDTPLHAFTAEQKKLLAGAQPLGRVGEPSEIADAVVFLLESKWTTGAILAVDGGISLT